MQKSFPLIFGGVIALILLALYASTVIYMICDVLYIAGTKSPKPEPNVNEGMVFAVTTIGALVSALVIAQLAITKPRENPTIIKMAKGDDGKSNKMVATIVVVYLTVWLIVGLAAFVIADLLHPDINDTLRNVGRTWLGLAIAAGYAYFGIKPSA